MKKIILRCEDSTNKKDNKLGVYFQGWLLHQLPDEVATALHESIIKPYTVSVKQKNGMVEFIVTVLKDDLIREVDKVLLSDGLNTIGLTSSKQKEFMIKERVVKVLTEKDLSQMFYQVDAAKKYALEFYSSTSFKAEGEYYFFPDLRLIYQSLMRKYNVIFENNNHVDQDLLNELVAKTKIVSYRVQSTYYPIHKSFIPGFTGTIKVSCFGNQTLANYLNMLLRFGSFAGVGIKTSMGMGAVEYQEIKKGD